MCEHTVAGGYIGKVDYRLPKRRGPNGNSGRHCKSRRLPAVISEDNTVSAIC